MKTTPSPIGRRAVLAAVLMLIVPPVAAAQVPDGPPLGRTPATQDDVEWYVSTVRGSDGDFDGDGNGTHNLTTPPPVWEETDALNTTTGRLLWNTSDNKNRTEENATGLQTYLADGLQDGGDFDGDGTPLDPTDLASVERELVALAGHVDRRAGNLSDVYSSQHDNVTAFAGNISEGVARGGDLDGNGSGPLDHVSAAWERTLSDLGALVQLTAGRGDGLAGRAATHAPEDVELARAATDGPTITGVSWAPPQPMPDEEVTVRAHLADPNGVGGARIVYGHDSTASRAPMEPAGEDRSEWTGTIPARFSDYDTVAFHVVAWDASWTGQTGSRSEVRDAIDELEERTRRDLPTPPGTSRSDAHDFTVGDATPPSIDVDVRALIGTGNPWTLRVDATDNGGIDAVDDVRARYRTPQGAWHTLDLDRPSDGRAVGQADAPDAPGTMRILVGAADETGNRATAEVAVQVVDDDPPKLGPMRVEPVAGGLQVRVPAEDNVGIEAADLTIWTGSGQRTRVPVRANGTAVVADLPDPGDADLRLRLRVWDRAGNLAEGYGTYFGDEGGTIVSPDVDTGSSDGPNRRSATGPTEGPQPKDLTPDRTAASTEASPGTLTVPGPGALLAVVTLAGAALAWRRRRG